MRKKIPVKVKTVAKRSGSGIRITTKTTVGNKTKTTSKVFH